MNENKNIHSPTTSQMMQEVKELLQKQKGMILTELMKIQENQKDIHDLIRNISESKKIQL